MSHFIHFLEYLQTSTTKTYHLNANTSKVPLSDIKKKKPTKMDPFFSSIFFPPAGREIFSKNHLLTIIMLTDFVSLLYVKFWLGSWLADQIGGGRFLMARWSDGGGGRVLMARWSDGWWKALELFKTFIIVFLVVVTFFHKYATDCPFHIECCTKLLKETRE